MSDPAEILTLAYAAWYAAALAFGFLAGRAWQATADWEERP